MKKITAIFLRLITLLLILCCSIVILSGCSSAEPIEYTSIRNSCSVYSLVKNPPSGYKMLLPYLDSKDQEAHDQMKSDRILFPLGPEIEICKDNEIVCGIDFLYKNDAKTKMDEMIECSKENKEYFGDKVEIIKEITEEEIHYALFFVNSSRPEACPDHYMIVGMFSKSEDAGFMLVSKASQDETEKIFNSMALKYLHD